MQSGSEDTLEERYAIKFCFKLGRNATETYGMLQTAFGASSMNRASGFKWHKKFKEGSESVRDDERCGRSKEVNTPELIGQRVRIRAMVTMFRWKRPALFKSSQWHFHRDNAPDLAPCDFWLFPKPRGCRYETIEDMKEAVTKFIDTLTQEDFHGTFQKLLEEYKWIATGGDYFEWDQSFMCVP